MSPTNLSKSNLESPTSPTLLPISTAISAATCRSSTPFSPSIAALTIRSTNSLLQTSFISKPTFQTSPTNLLLTN
ncbi:hypothetical protein IEQ34_004784 [Dendrobium chrysotoxum]|uniref:Uncharacterized protein n=1 Tax=Dendrobium chrysotoxum TaxID=161865 RepID=A0AAV7H702_DENCH|nr:hypothetical protein IEQ34_004784 [Dendrobium chrysotoxum]